MSYFTKEYARSNKGRTTYEVRYDGCNGFVYYGGIVWIVLVSAALFPVGILLARKIHDRRIAGPTPNSVLLNVSPAENNTLELVLPPASAVPLRAKSGPLPNAEGFLSPVLTPFSSIFHSRAGFFLRGASIDEVNGV